MSNLYYVCSEDGEYGLSYFNNDDDSLTCIANTSNKLEWREFTYEDAIEASRHTGYCTIIIDK